MIQPHEDDLIETLRGLILSNQDQLTLGLSVQGKPRTIAQIAGNRHVLDRVYYFIRIGVPKFQAKPASPGPRPISWKIEYEIDMEIMDLARIQEEKEPYQSTNRDLRTLVGRIVKLITGQQGWLQGQEAQYGRPFETDQLAVRVQNLSDIFEDQDGNHFAGLITKISFILIECTS